MSLRCGIDLGTTYSAISWYDSFNNRVETVDLESADGAKMIRSVVYYPGSGQPAVVGETAWNACKHAADRVVVGIKRSMGTSWKVPPIDGTSYTPQQVSSEILKALARDAEAVLSEKVTEVVITVPAYFGDNERAATLEAGQLAGLTVLGLLPEPHAAALAYAADKVVEIMDRAVLVYDLGGGTFDVTLIRATTAPNPEHQINLRIDTLCKDGNAQLGGLDWDRNLMELVAEKAQQQHNVDVRADPGNEAFLLDNCEKAKRNLTRAPSVQIDVDQAGHKVEITRDEFEERTRDLLYQSQALVEHVLEEAEKKHGLTRDKIEVLLAGGSSRMPMVKKMLEGLMGQPPKLHKNPELLVTIGAAYWAHLLQSGETITVPVQTPEGTIEPRDIILEGLTDVSAVPVGVEVIRGDGKGGMKRFVAPLIPRGARYDETFSKEFATSEDNMTSIPITLYEGESDDPDACKRLLDATISGLPGGRPRGQRVKVSLGYDSSGIIRGEAIDVATNSRVELLVDRTKA